MQASAGGSSDRGSSSSNEGNTNLNRFGESAVSLEGDSFDAGNLDTYRNVAKTFNEAGSESVELSEDFSVDDLGSNVLRSVGGESTSFEMRSSSVAHALHGGKALGAQVFSAAAKPTANAIGLTQSSFASASDNVHVPEPPKLPPSPYFLDRNSFDLSRSHVAASRVHTDLQTIFSEANVDFIFQPEKWQFVCKAYPNNEPVNFRVRLYARSAETYALEFQQRSGCRFSYSTLLTRMKKRLALSDASEGLSPNNTGSSFEMRSSTVAHALHANKGPSDQFETVPSAEDLKSILGMLTSEYCEVQSEGLKIVARLAESKAACDVLADGGIIAVAVKVLEGRFGGEVELRRCVATAVARFAQTTDSFDSLHSSVPLVVKLVLGSNPEALSGSASKMVFEEKYGELNWLEVQRLGVQALTSLARSPKVRSLIVENGGLRELQHLCSSSDRRLSQYAQEGMIALSKSSNIPY